MNAESGPVIGDAFGATLLACLDAAVEPNTVQEIIERSDGHIAASDVSRYFAPPEGEETEWIFERVTGPVLDIGAGAGRYALALQERGTDVVALDISPGALEVCRRRGVRETYLGTIEELARDGGGPFNTFLLMGANLGLLGAPEDTRRFLEALARLSAPGAQILAEGNDASATRDQLHLAYHEANESAGRSRHLVRMRVRHRGLASGWFNYLMPTVEELRRLIEPSGWTVADSVSGTGWMSASAYLVALSRK